MSKLSDKIWFTRKARIQASERLLMNNQHAQFTLILYSLVNVALSIYMLKESNPVGRNSDITLTIISVCILVLSLFISNIDFKGRAEKLKKNYLNLHELYEKSELPNADELQINSEYIKLLSDSENHKTIDDKFFRVTNYKSLSSRKPTIPDFIEVIFYTFIRKLLIISIYTAPFALLIFNK
ncbi:MULTISPECIES: SLATT domain-containing protein [Pseudoalteromonas]|uniref:SLATT domain-containing protein n=1 Tax=Pseudoalteromonas TaxID=53246 RepID=UPI00020A09C1|nr:MULTISPECIES: SLATT domain-containing protein [Pseudoalteromonas]EGI73625.1 hypothetical protein PH505_ap00760 [Pseudoalteromonas distincta]|tara:strand:- start:10567 stop:11112 length:546 start_codon:yes stop_codon:yes gene_type:complete